MGKETFRHNVRLFMIPQHYSKSRRTLLKYTLTAPLAAHIPSFFDEYATLSLQQAEKARGVDEVLFDMRRIEEKVGFGRVSLEQTKEYIPLVAEFFVLATGVPIASQALSERTHLVRGYSLEQATEQFEKDYPAFSITKEVRDEIDTGFRRSLFGSQSPTHGMLIYLDKINNQFGLQFTNRDGHLVCEKYSPIVRLRHILLHEYFHDISNTSKRSRFDPDLERIILQRVERHYNFPKHVEHSGFIVFITKETGQEIPLMGFYEFSTEYLTIKLLRKYKLDYTQNDYGFPHDFSNFEQMLAQADISDQEFQQLYRLDNIRTFLLRISTRFQRSGPDGLENTDNLIGLAFDQTIGMNSLPPRWSHLQQYFHGIDPRTRAYLVPPLQQDLPNPRPCIVIAYE